MSRQPERSRQGSFAESSYHYLALKGFCVRQAIFNGRGNESLAPTTIVLFPSLKLFEFLYMSFINSSSNLRFSWSRVGVGNVHRPHKACTIYRRIIFKLIILYGSQITLQISNGFLQKIGFLTESNLLSFQLVQDVFLSRVNLFSHYDITCVFIWGRWKWREQLGLIISYLKVLPLFTCYSSDFMLFVLFCFRHIHCLT